MSEMQDQSGSNVDAAIEAVSDPTRRRVVEVLAEGPLRTRELAEQLDVSVPALSRHLKLLRERGIVHRVDVEGDARGREYHLDTTMFAALANWLSPGRWASAMSDVTDDATIALYLERVGGFLDAFLTSDAGFFERHTADDALLFFPRSAEPWRKEATVASVAGHPPYVEWDVGDTHLQALAPGVMLVAIEVRTRRTADTDPSEVIQTMVFVDTPGGGPDDWVMRFLQQTPT